MQTFSMYPPSFFFSGDGACPCSFGLFTRGEPGGVASESTWVNDGGSGAGEGEGEGVRVDEGRAAGSCLTLCAASEGVIMFR